MAGKIFQFAFLFFFISIFSSCSILDYPSRIAGYSMMKFENQKAASFQKSFKTSKEIAFKKSINIIAKLKARITHQSYKKGYIVAFELSKYFPNCLDSTEAAVFIDEIDENTVKITIVCNNHLLASEFSVKFFEMFSISSDKWSL
ncbi:MAG: hypothetical protein LBT79_03200 [Elusimicrobiota bacterium]|jgi:hypothetical protein|nr:hypothetical protein [Elusimicrobiota bacterium]